MGLFQTTPVSPDKIRTTRQKRSGVMAGSMPDDENPATDIEFDLPELSPGKSYKNKYGGKTTELDDGSVEIEFEPDNLQKMDPQDHDANLAEFIDQTDLSNIAEDILQGIDADLTSRGDLEGMVKKSIDLCGLKIEDVTESQEGTISKDHHSLLIEAVVRYQSNAGAELLPAAGPVKVRDDTPPDAILGDETAGMPGIGHNGGPGLDTFSAPQGGMMNAPGGMGASLEAPPENETDRTALAEALESDMNHYLTVVAKEYYPDFYRLLFAQGLMGCAFKKIYDCPLRRRPVSDFISMLDLIVSQDATDLYTAGRVTHRTKMRQSVMKRMQILGVYREIDLSIPNEETPDTDRKIKEVDGVSSTNLSPLPRDQQYTLYECYTELDIPGYEHEEDGEVSGLPLPYRVTIEKDSRQILEIRRNWKEGDETFTARRRFVKYGLIPGLGFYDYGYMHILGNTTKALTAIERMLLDAGMFACFPGFLIAEDGARQTTNVMRVRPGTGKGIATGGLPIRDAAMPLPYKEPSAVLGSLAEAIAGDARALAGFLEIPTGEGVQNIPVGTMLAMVEQATKVMGAIHKRNHASHQEELSILRELFAENPEAIWKFSKSPQRKWQVEMEFRDMALVPASDPNIPSHIHRIMQGTALLELSKTAPDLYDNREVHERLLRILGFQDIKKILNPPAPPQAGPPPNPEAQTVMLEAQARAAEQNREIQQDAVRGKLKMQEKQMDMADRQADRASKQQIAVLNVKKELLKADANLKSHILGIAAHSAKKRIDVAAQHAAPKKKSVEKKGNKSAEKKKPS